MTTKRRHHANVKRAINARSPIKHPKIKKTVAILADNGADIVATPAVLFLADNLQHIIEHILGATIPGGALPAASATIIIMCHWLKSAAEKAKIEVEELEKDL